MQQRSSHHCAGFTIVEVAIAVFIVGILAAVAVPSFFRSLHSFRVRYAAERIKADLGRARTIAKTTSLNQTVEFNLAGQWYELPGLPDLDHPSLDYGVELSQPPYQVTLVTADFGGDGQVIFDLYGTPDSAGTVVIESGGYAQTISLDAETGRANLP